MRNGARGESEVFWEGEENGGNKMKQSFFLNLNKIGLKGECSLYEVMNVSDSHW
jgi:hypothetical protein